MSFNSSHTFVDIGYAKLNIALHVRKRMPNGYHELETVFAFVDQGDVVSVSPAEDLKLEISGPFSNNLEINNNLVLKAAGLMRSEFRVTKGAKIHLVKNLPIASGIGGGSADAAAALRLLNRFWGLNKSQSELQKIAASLGADVPACVASKTAIGTGIGQQLEPLQIPFLEGLHVLLANPLVKISTKEIFENWDGVDLGPLNRDDIQHLLTHGRNDLQPIAIALNRNIMPLLTAMKATNPIAARMSGSGATCFAVYESAECVKVANEFLQSSIEEVWTMSGQVR